MALRRFTAEGSPSGTTLTAANSGTGSGDALNTVFRANGATVAYSNVQAKRGLQSLLVTATAAIDEAILGFSGMTANNAALEFYIYLSSGPSLGATQIGQIRATGGIATYSLSTARVLTVLNAASSGVMTFASPLSLNTWYRIALRAVPGTTTTNGTIEAAYYLGDSTTPVEPVFSSTAANAGVGGPGTVTDGRFGKLNGAGDLIAYFDDPSVLDNSVGFIGPTTVSTLKPAASRLTGGSWKGATFYRRTGGVWKTAILYRRIGGVWVRADTPPSAGLGAQPLGTSAFGGTA